MYKLADFVNLRKKWSSADWEMIDSFEVDCWLYKVEIIVGRS